MEVPRDAGSHSMEQTERGKHPSAGAAPFPEDGWGIAVRNCGANHCCSAHAFRPAGVHDGSVDNRFRVEMDARIFRSARTLFALASLDLYRCGTVAACPAVGPVCRRG